MPPLDFYQVRDGRLSPARPELAAVNAASAAATTTTTQI